MRAQQVRVTPAGRRAGHIYPEKFLDALAELAAAAEKITTDDPTDEPALSKSV